MADIKLSTIAGGSSMPVLKSVKVERLNDTGIRIGNILATFTTGALQTIVDITEPSVASFMGFCAAGGTATFTMTELIITVNGAIVPLTGIPHASTISRDTILKVFGGFFVGNVGAAREGIAMTGVPFRFETLKIEAATSGAAAPTLFSDLELVQ